MKKYFYYLLIFSLFLFAGSNQVFAAFNQFTHELNYDITSVKLSDDNIRFQGWAFIDHLDNVGGKNLQIAITAYDSSTGKSYTIIEDEYGKIDLYESRFAAYNGLGSETKASIEKKKYNGVLNSDVYDFLCIEGVSNSTYANKVGLPTSISGGSTCLYYNLKFDISFDLSTLVAAFGINSNITFYINARLSKFGTGVSGSGVGAWPWQEIGNGDIANATPARQWSNDSNPSFSAYRNKWWKSSQIFVYDKNYHDNTSGTGSYKAIFVNEKSTDFIVTYNGPKPIKYWSDYLNQERNVKYYSVGNTNNLFFSKVKTQNGLSYSNLSSLNNYVNGSNSNGNSFKVVSYVTNGTTYQSYIGSKTASTVATYDLIANAPSNISKFRYTYFNRILIYPVKDSTWKVRVSSAWGTISGGNALTIKIEQIAKNLYCKDVYRSTMSSSKSVSGNACPIDNIKYYECEDTSVSATIYYKNNTCSINVKAKVLIDEVGTLNIGDLLDTAGNKLLNGDVLNSVTAGTGFGIGTTSYVDEFSWSFAQVNASDGVTPYYVYTPSSGCGDGFNVYSVSDNKFSNKTSGYNMTLASASYMAISNEILRKYNEDAYSLDDFVTSYSSNNQSSYSFDDSSFGKWVKSQTSGTIITEQNKVGYSSYGYNPSMINYNSSTGDWSRKNNYENKYYKLQYDYSFNTAYINRYDGNVTYDDAAKNNTDIYVDGGKFKYIPIAYPYATSAVDVSDDNKFPLKFATNSSFYLSIWSNFKWTFTGTCSTVRVAQGLYECPDGNCTDGGSLDLSYNYRSIDVDNPFPRAIDKDDYPENWRYWYCGDDENCSSDYSGNKLRIKESYKNYSANQEKSNPLYSVIVDDIKLSKIRGIDYFYTNWSVNGNQPVGITGNTGSSVFVENFFDKKASSLSYCPLGVWDDNCDQLR